MSILQERCQAVVDGLVAIEREKANLLASLENPISPRLVKALAKKTMKKELTNKENELIREFDKFDERNPCFKF